MPPPKIHYHGTPPAKEHANAKPLKPGTKVRLMPMVGTVADWCPQCYGKIGLELDNGVGVIIDRACIEEVPLTPYEQACNRLLH
jgi:hypothetical protein